MFQTFGLPILGGILIGAAAVLLWLTLGRIAGISGIAARALQGANAGGYWPLAFLIGLGGGGWLGYLFVPRPVVPPLDGAAIALIALAGLLVGFGTRLGSGCTSGHGVCGISRFSLRSLTATVTFLAVGLATATLVHA